MLLVVAMQKRDRARELVRRVFSNGFAPGREKRRVQDRDADWPEHDQAVGPIAGVLVFARRAIERVVVVQ
eukprot:1663876-Pleurochrysis_carterae.AAC.1